MILEPEKIKSQFHSSWFELLKPEIEKDYFQQAMQRLKEEATSKNPVYPKFKDMFRPWLLPIDKIRVVIVADQPQKDSDGLAFSTRSMDLNSLTVGMFQEILYSDVMSKQKGITLDDMFCCGDLTQWTKQGVMLLNRTLTTGTNPLSHLTMGWTEFTDKTLEILDAREEPIVFIVIENSHLIPAIDVQKHEVIIVDKIRNSNCFVDCNKFLKTRYNQEINWGVWPNQCSHYILRVLNENWKDIPRLADRVQQEWSIPTYFQAYFDKYFGKDWINLLDMFGANKLKNLIQVTCYQSRIKPPKKGKELLFEEDNFLFLMQCMGATLNHDSIIQIEIQE